MAIDVRWALGSGLVAALALACPTNDARAEDVPRLSVRIASPPALAFDATALGHATHRVQITFGNPNPTPIALGPHAFRFTPSKDGITYECEEGTDDTRWPTTLGPGVSVMVERAVRCHTPLVGRYDVEVRAKRIEPQATENVVGSFSLVIDGGPNAPVRSPSDGRVWIAASATREMRNGPNAVARMQFAFVNASRDDVTVAPARFAVRIMRRESTAPPCPERFLDVRGGKVAGGKSLGVTLPLACDFGREGVYDADVSLLGPNGRQKVALLAIRAAILPTPNPLPQSKSLIDRQGPL